MLMLMVILMVMLQFLNLHVLQPVGYVTDATDCNDNNAAVNPGATEVCNSIDDDCDGLTDEGVTLLSMQMLTVILMEMLLSSTQACTAPVGYVTDATDCNDNNAAVNPGATEVCNSIDDDCDGSTDEGVLLTFYADVDGDTDMVMLLHQLKLVLLL
jgi:hypothetical protein